MSPERPAPAEPADLAARAAQKHVVVVGGGVGGLVAARECAKVGMRVTLLEGSEALGGVIRRVALDGVVVDAGAESYATKGGHVRALVDDLGLSDRVVTPQAGGAWLAGIPGGGAAPLPAGGILGIPGNPFQDDVRRIIGWSGAWRAYLDRVRPPLTIGHQLSLGRLVASRMGEKVRDRLVAPVTTGVYSASPDDVDIDVAAPGLNAALTRVGSLSGAVLALRGEGASRGTKTPGAAVEGLVGGMSVLVDALAADLDELGATVRTRVRARRLTTDGTTWRVVVEEPAAEGPTEGEEVTQEAELVADAVIVATSEHGARELLAGAVPALAAADAAPAPEIEIISLLLDAPALRTPPRGTGVLTVPHSHTAKALTHSTAKWSWVREAAGDREVVRVSFGAQGEPAATAALDDEAAIDLARREASALLGIPLSPDQVVAGHRGRFVQAQPASIIGSGERRAAARQAVQAVPGLAAVGAWLAGTGLAQVVPDAAEEADRLRRALLWD
ncbi:FAD-dependent oxidoreductase [Microbacterium sp. p3-SID338]|uniref:protoporphyrinogen/coproporphyrinogen oxidase n=1 Tax=unclassified Microbacterium TaxID=2609290 RepID=UPI000C80FAD9|nr:MULTISPECIES: FAD-dependent oxidoreductase [unclassified Microbacterium]MCT1395956.1 FAD-dependent oxidoreductase [Microbacterium sp. p3-SID338]PMC02947.1 protoporphyrinogen oxidase [Microbacterium sp. UMB0228]